MEAEGEHRRPYRRRTPRPDPDRPGRPSQLITTFGVGSVFDLPSMSVIMRGLDAWSPEQQDTIDEPRLLNEVLKVLGGQVRALRTAPWDPAERDDPWSCTGVPVTPFPRWVRCPRCHRLGPLDPPGQFELVHRYGRRPDLAKFVHAHCPRQATTRNANKRACVRARTRGGAVACPGCGTETSRVHGYHERTAADVPVDGRRVLVKARVRRMRCPALDCKMQTFREQVCGVLERLWPDAG